MILHSTCFNYISNKKIAKMHTNSYFKTQYYEHLLITSDPTETVNTHDKYWTDIRIKSMSDITKKFLFIWRNKPKYM
jgi:hypothetical protein